jgi:Asp-tRNA(Asn)/Glu-tRNA(Gln) amidotransferase A subunit family amidase
MLNSSLQQIGSALRARKISSVELTQLYLDRIAALNPALNAFITTNAEASLDCAEGHLLREGLAHHLRIENAGELHRAL